MMSPSDRAELLRLLWAMCDQTISRDERDRLERLIRDDAESRRTYALFMGMVQSLGRRVVPARSEAVPPLTATSDDPAPVPQPRHERRPYRLAAVSSVLRNPIAAAACCAAIVLGSVLGVWYYFSYDQFAAARPNWVMRPSAPFATLSGAEECRWGDVEWVPAVGARVPVRRLDLEQGLAELTFDSGAKLVIEGPADFEIRSLHRTALYSGKLLANVPDHVREFTVDTPRGTVLMRGTEMGIISEPTGRTEVFAFTGPVEIQPRPDQFRSRFGKRRTSVGERGGAAEQTVYLTAGESLRIHGGVERGRDIDSTPFVHRLPAPLELRTQVKAMRDFVAQDARLIHHYTFEGNRGRGEHLADSKGSADLIELPFGAGSSGAIDYHVGLDSSTVAFTPQRTGPTSGGAGLITEREIELPRRLTVECLVRPSSGCFGGNVLSARAGLDFRGGFIRKSDRGPFLGVTIGSTRREINAPRPFYAGHWYYVAASFEPSGDDTVVNLYVANVAAMQGSLAHAGNRSHTATGNYGTSSKLRIGMGVLRDGSHSAAFSGAIDEVALYNDVLTRAELEQRLKVLQDGTRDLGEPVAKLSIGE